MNSLLLCALVSALLALSTAQAPRDEELFCTETLPGIGQNVVNDPPNERILMDTTHYNFLIRTGGRAPPVWQTLDLDSNNDPAFPTTWTEIGGPCDSRVTVCGYTIGIQDNWLITQHINRTLPNGQRLDQLILRVEYQQTECDSNPCQRVFDIQKYETSTVDPAAARVTTNYVLVSSFTTRTTSGEETEISEVEIDFTSNETGFYLAIQDQGTCIVIIRLVVFYYVCPAESVDGVARPETISPSVGTGVPVQITAPCVENAMPEGDPPVQSCLERGRWLPISAGDGCVCNDGFISTNNNTQCIICPAGMYASVANDMCLACPNNSNSSVSGLAECPCDEGFYRTQQEIDLPCSLPPSAPRNVMIVETTSTTITLSWEEPLSLGGRSSEELRYNLWYQGPGDNQPQLATTVTNTTGEITGLAPDVSYTVFVSSETDITAGIPLQDLALRAGVMPVKTQSIDPGIIAGIIVGVLAVILILVILVILLLCCLRKQKKIVKETISHYQAENTIALPKMGKRMYVDPTTYASPDEAVRDFAKEIRPRSVNLISEIGAGEFGNVYKGTWKDQGKQIPIAVKTLRGGSNHRQRNDFLTEASIMGQFDHSNVIKLYGVVTKVEPVMIVMEFMNNGSLYHYLRKNDDKLGPVRQAKMAKQVAQGMDYLATVGFVHRDLAARNILVGENEECKVADFGLSRETVDDEYDVKKGGKIPVRWTAPEAIFRRRFTTASDVWSYGVLLWEVMSYGQHPYEAFDWDNQTVLDKLDAGYRLDNPHGCPQAVYQLMLNCWHAEKNDRPTFADIVQYIDRLLENNFETSISNPAPAKKVPKTYLTTANILNPLDYPTVEEWLLAIKMDKYKDNFTEAGITEIGQVVNLTEEDVRSLGVKLAGHVYKITTSIEKAHTQISRQPSVKV